MWRRMAAPDLILPPAQAGVFRAALGSLSDFIGWEAETAGWDSGVPIFDRLTQGQQQVALLTIAQALLRRQCPAPRVTAVLAAAVSATYDALLSLIEADLFFETGDTALRRQVLAAVAETGYWAGVGDAEAAAAAPAEKCADREVWSECVGILRDAILDDTDYELADQMLDLEPDAGGAVKRWLAIDRDYFVTVPDDPSPARLQELHHELLGLLGGPEGEP
jgi:hypothetical protein